jgi:hypothetical protein
MITVKRLLPLVVIIALMPGASDVAYGQCSMCRSLLATPEGQRMAGALREAIWILLAAPFLVFGVIAMAAVRSRKRLEAADQS